MEGFLRCFPEPEDIERKLYGNEKGELEISTKLTFAPGQIPEKITITYTRDKRKEQPQ